jgi:apolipoprotein N-acyltransferase
MRLFWLISGLALLAYTAGLHWIFISLHEYGGLPAWLSAISTVLLAAYVALYAVAAFALCRWLTGSTKQLVSGLIIAAVVTLAEWLRGTLFTGFPWLSLGYLAIDTPMAGYAPLVGVYGVGFFTALAAVWIVQAIRYRNWPAFLGVVGIMAVGFFASLHPFTEPEGRPLRVALVQGAIPQSMKFDPAREALAIQQQIAIANTGAMPGAVQLIVFPETAMVRPWEMAEPWAREAFQGLAQRSGATVMLGLPMRDSRGWFNSLIALDPENPLEIKARYDKHHLVPFGEFIPFGFRWFVDMMNMPLGDFQRGEKIQAPITVQDQRIGVNICYEDLFGEEIIRPLSPALAREQHPSILLNVSNLAWFGNTIALDQHLDIARMRSKETGRPSIRATNTGATAAINEYGHVLEHLPHGKAGLLYAQVQGMQGITPYSRFGNWPILLLSLLIVMGRWITKLRSR